MTKTSRTLALVAFLLFLSSTAVQAQSENLVWNRDNKHVKKKVEHPAAPEGVTGDWIVMRSALMIPTRPQKVSVAVGSPRILKQIRTRMELWIVMTNVLMIPIRL